ncbi:MAG: SigE family RNA polymerase sigma factor [Actinomycetota bacterium]
MQITVEQTEPLVGGRLAVLYAEHAPEAVRLAYLLTGNRPQAEDLVQDAFVRLAGRFLDLRDPQGFGHYLRRTIVNLTNSWWRRKKVERAYLEREMQHPVAADASGHDPVEREALWQSLQRLNARQRTAIVLRFYQDLSEEQTAEAMGVPRGTVKSLVSRGLEAMRGQIRGE